MFGHGLRHFGGIALHEAIHWGSVGLVLFATGFTPDHWIEELHHVGLPTSPPQFPDTRLLLMALGIVVFGLSVLIRVRQARRPAPVVLPPEAEQGPPGARGIEISERTIRLPDGFVSPEIAQALLIRTAPRTGDGSELPSNETSAARAIGNEATPTAGLPLAERCIGRDPQLNALVASLCGASNPSCIVLGGPGIGKTTLTLAAAHNEKVAARFGPRRWFVPLETASDAAAFQTTIVTAIGLNPANAKFEDALAKLGEQPSLMILDNLETPWEADTQAVETALRQIAAVPDTTLLASIRGGVAPHSPRWTLTVRVEPLDDTAARTLFCEIAPNISANDPHLGDFLDVLGGVPLAIELVAFRAADGDHDTLAELWREWQRVGADLAARPGVDAARLTSLPKSIELSLTSRRISNSGERLFRLLGQLPAGIAAEDRAALLGDMALRAAEELTAVGLAVRRDGRLDLLAPIRDHGRRFYPPDAEDSTRWCEHYLALLADRGNQIGSEGGAAAAARLTPEWPNFVAVIGAELDSGRSPDTSRTLAGLASLMQNTGVGSTGVVERWSAACGNAGDNFSQARCLEDLGDILRSRSEYEAAENAYRRALPIYHDGGNGAREASCIQRLGEIALYRSDLDAARRAIDEALPLFRRVGSALGEANGIQRLGDIALARSDYDTASRAYDEALLLYRRVGNVLGEANCIQLLGEIALRRNDHEPARRAYEEALLLYRSVGHVLGEASCIKGLGDIALNRSELDVARRAYNEALPLFRRIGSALGEANCIQRLGNIAFRRADHEDARRTYEGALAVYTRIPAPYSIGWTHLDLARVSDGTERSAHLAAARAAWLSIDRQDLIEQNLPAET